MALRQRHKVDRAVAMLMVVPVGQFRGLALCGQQTSKWFNQQFGTVLRSSKCRIYIGIAQFLIAGRLRVWAILRRCIVTRMVSTSLGSRLSEYRIRLPPPLQQLDEHLQRSIDRRRHA